MPFSRSGKATTYVGRAPAWVLPRTLLRTVNERLAAVERVFQRLKHLVDIRPVYHQPADRIQAHVPLCRPGLL